MFKSERSLAWLAFWAVAIFWGTTFLAIRVGVASFPPFLMAACRHTAGGILICSYFLLRGYKLPGKSQMKVFAVNGIIMLLGGNGIISWGMKYVDSGLTALICALTPLWIVLINKLKGGTEKVGLWAYVGFVICLAGQFFIFKDKLDLFSDNNYVWGIAAVVVSNFLWGLGTVYSRNHQTQTHALFAAGLQMIPGGLSLFILSAVAGEFSDVHPEPEAIISLAYLVVFGSIVAYGSYMYMLKKLPAAIGSTYAYINTIVAVFLGWWFLNEVLNFNMIIASVLTIAGVWLINKNVTEEKRASSH